mgnify:CR=1 FL=1
MWRPVRATKVALWPSAILSRVAEKPFTDLYKRFTGAALDPDELGIRSKLEIMDTELATDIERLTGCAHHHPEQRALRQ